MHHIAASPRRELQLLLTMSPTEPYVPIPKAVATTRTLRARCKTCLTSLRERTYELIEPAPDKTRYSDVFNCFVFVLILLNAIAVFLQLAVPIHHPVLRVFEITSILFFLVEYLMRLFTCDLGNRSRKKPVSILLFLVSPAAVFDLLSLLPLFFHTMIPLDLRAMRLLRLPTLFRYTRKATHLSKALHYTSRDLTAIVAVSITCVLLTSFIVYCYERQENYMAFPNLGSSVVWAFANVFATPSYITGEPISTGGQIAGGVLRTIRCRRDRIRGSHHRVSD